MTHARDRVTALLQVLLLAALLLAAGTVPAAGAPERDRPRAEAGFPPSLRAWIEEQTPERRWRAEQRLRRMGPARRDAFFRRWESMSDTQRREFQDRLERRAEHAERRRARARSQDRDRACSQDRDRPCSQDRDRVRRQNRDAAAWRDRPDSPPPSDRPPGAQEADRFDRPPGVQEGDRFDRNRRAWRDLGPGDRQRMRARLERFRDLTPSQQEAAVDRHFSGQTAARRARILERMRAAASRLPPAPR